LLQRKFLTLSRGWVYYPPMRRYAGKMRWLVVVGLICWFGSASALAQHHERKRIERAEISLLEEKWRQAQLAEDIPTMDRLLADEFLGITAAGQVVTKAQQLDRMRTHHLTLKQLDISDTKMKISGNLAVVTSLAHLDGSADGKPLHGDFRYTRVYHRIGRGDWKITNFEATRVGSDGLPLKTPPANAPRTSSAEPPATSSNCLPASPAGYGSPQQPS
jgi:ketosteroid isomerase-like protein